MNKNNKLKKLKIVLIAITIAIVAIIIGYTAIEIIKTRFLQPLII